MTPGATVVRNIDRLERLGAMTDAWPWLNTSTKTSAGEDIEPFLSGEEPVARYCAVTRGFSDDGDTIIYGYPTFDCPKAAKTKAGRYVNDDIFVELPIGVFDLDTGEELTPIVSVAWADEDPLGDPPKSLADAWRRYRAGDRVEPWEVRKLDEWRAARAEDEGF